MGLIVGVRNPPTIKLSLFKNVHTFIARYARAFTSYVTKTKLTLSFEGFNMDYSEALIDHSIAKCRVKCPKMMRALLAYFKRGFSAKACCAFYAVAEAAFIRMCERVAEVALRDQHKVYKYERLSQ